MHDYAGHVQAKKLFIAGHCVLCLDSLSSLAFNSRFCVTGFVISYTEFSRKKTEWIVQDSKTICK